MKNCRAAIFVISIVTILILTTPTKAAALPCCDLNYVFYPDCTVSTSQ